MIGYAYTAQLDWITAAQVPGARWDATRYSAETFELKEEFQRFRT